MQRNLTREVDNFKEFGNLITQHGQDIVLALVILVVGLIGAKLLGRLFKLALQRLPVKEAFVSMATNIFYIILLLLVATAALHRLGIKDVVRVDRITVLVVLLGVVKRPVANQPLFGSVQT